MTPDGKLSPSHEAGFANPVFESQSAFRCVMNALARPGSMQTLTGAVNAPPMLMPATAAIALTLFDHDTPIWIDERFSAEAEISAWLRFQTGAPCIQDTSRVAFALIASGAVLPDFGHFALGTPEYPDRSTTLMIQVDTFSEGTELSLMGPGIKGTPSLRAGALPSNFSELMQANRALFPRGLDMLLVCGAELIALPRSTHVVAREA